VFALGTIRDGESRFQRLKWFWDYNPGASPQAKVRTRRLALLVAIQDGERSTPDIALSDRRWRSAEGAIHR